MRLLLANADRTADITVQIGPATLGRLQQVKAALSTRLLRTASSRPDRQGYLLPNELAPLVERAIVRYQETAT